MQQHTDAHRDDSGPERAAVSEGDHRAGLRAVANSLIGIYGNDRAGDSR
jgi:hypothetical protein